MTILENSSREPFRENFVKSINFLNKKARKEAFKRSRDLDKIFAKLCLYRVGIHEVEDLPRQEFRCAVQRYVIGLYEDAIYHACFSVEMALLIKLDEKLSENEKSAIHEAINKTEGKPVSFTFGTMFNRAKAKEVGIISGVELSKKFVTLIEKRNTYIHVNNFLSGLIITLKKKEIVEIESILKDIAELENIPIVGGVIQRFYPGIPRLKSYLKEQLTLIMSLPDFSWCSKDKHRLNTERQVEEYMKRLEHIKKEKVDTSSAYKKILSAIKLRGTIKDVLSMVYLKGQSLEILEYSFEILKEIGIF